VTEGANLVDVVRRAQNATQKQAHTVMKQDDGDVVELFVDQGHST